MDEILEPEDTVPEPLITIEEIRERLKPYYAKKFAGTPEERVRAAISAKIAWFEYLLQTRGNNEELELIG